MTTGLTIPLGPFQLERTIGRGGMGMVWLGHHLDQGVPVAVKVITGRAASSPEYQAAFAREVQAAAQLEHPGIVWLYDYGRIPKDAARASDFQLVEGSPFLVMEYASQGTLRDAAAEGLPWPKLRSTLLALLDALAHAHARGVIHRDIKPDNVLIAGPDDMRPGLKLTDYGIAHPIDEGHSSAGDGKPMGTPHYMAPEQIRAEVTQYGPHTDLYAFGCMVYKVVTGRLPFQGLKGPPLMYAQLTKPAPPMEPLHPIPEGLEEWVKVLMAKDPGDRFRRAADAALALAQLDAPPEQGRVRVLDDEDPLAAADAQGELETSTLKVVTSKMATPQERRISARIRPRLPETWRIVDQSNRPMRLLGAGLGLFGLRPVSFVGRDKERDHLWGALQSVHEEGMARVVVVRGPAGIGRSRLVQWVSERAHEVGGAQVMRAPFAPTGSSAERLRRMVVRFVRSWPQTDAALLAWADGLRQQTGLTDESPHVLLDTLLDPERSPLEEHQRHLLLRRVWEPLSARRPLVVVLDDAHWSMEALKLAQSVLVGREKAKLPVLVVVTVSDDIIDPYTELARRLDQLDKQEGASAVQLKTLPREASIQLVQNLLGLDDALARRVVARTGGNPLFATQLIGDWVERKVLVPGDEGFVLSDVDEGLPETIEEVWEERIRQLVKGLKAPSRLMLERAAILGREVDVFEWQQVCDDPDGAHARLGHVYFRPQHAKLRAELMDRLFASRLAQPTDDGFVFTHAQFREALLHHADLAGRTREHHHACGNVLLFQLDVANAERVARHLIGARRFVEAVPPLFLAVEHRIHTLGPHAALSLLDEMEAVMDQGRIGEDDRWWAELAARRAVALEAVDKHGEAWRAARHAWELSEPRGWGDLQALAALVQGSVSMTAGRIKEAEPFYLKVTTLIGRTGDPYVALQAWHRLRQLADRRGDKREAGQRAEALREVAQRANRGPAGAFGHVAIAGNALARGDLDDADTWARSSLDIAADAGDLLGQGRAHAVFADVCIARGTDEDVQKARDHFAVAIDRYEAIGDSGAIALRCKWSAWEAKRGEFERAQRAVEPGLLAEPDDRNLRAGLHVCMLISTAGRGKWPLFERHLTACTKLLPLVSNPSPLYAELVELAGDMCIQRRQRERAVKAWTLAEARWTALGQTRRAAQVAHRATTLGAP